MTQMAQATQTFVTSTDGTRIAVYVSGHGRPVVLVPGTSSDHTSWHLVQPLLDPHLSTYLVDRRGRGASGDGADYSLDLERADIAAVVDAAAARYGGPADLFGHSYGGNIAFGVASRSRNVRRLVLYEGWPPPDIAHRTYDPALLDHLDALLAAGQPDRMLRTFYRDVAYLTAGELDALVASPVWPARLAAAGSVPREIRAFGEHAFDAEQAARITAPVLLLVGADSPDELRANPEVVAAALPDARIKTLHGQTHIAHLAAPAALAAEMLAFLADS